MTAASTLLIATAAPSASTAASARAVLTCGLQQAELTVTMLLCLSGLLVALHACSMGTRLRCRVLALPPLCCPLRWRWFETAGRCTSRPAWQERSRGMPLGASSMAAAGTLAEQAAFPVALPVLLQLLVRPDM